MNLMCNIHTAWLFDLRDSLSFPLHLQLSLFLLNVPEREARTKHELRDDWHRITLTAYGILEPLKGKFPLHVSDEFLTTNQLYILFGHGYRAPS